MSPLPSTTLNLVKIDINDYLTLIDTPGLVDNGSILNRVDASMVKKISPKKEIKPRTYQLRKNQSIIIEDLIRIDYVEGEKNSFTLFVSNDLKVKRLLNLFNNDLEGEKNSKNLLLVLPAGKAAHIEAGIAYGLGKKCYAIGEYEQTDTLYNIFENIFESTHELETFLKEYK